MSNANIITNTIHVCTTQELLAVFFPVARSSSSSFVLFVDVCAEHRMRKKKLKSQHNIHVTIRCLNKIKSVAKPIWS